MPIMTRTTVPLLALPILGLSALAMGHGSMSEPISRLYSGYLEGPENPTSDAVQDAVDCGGTQPLYDWHQVANFFPGNADFQRTIPYDQYIPDGRLASANNDIYHCFDAARSDWPATNMTSGVTELVWAAWVIHNPSVFRVWLTTPDWDPDTALNWAQMEELDVGEVSLIDQEYRFEVDVPERDGRHVLYCIWQRLDPAGEGFYSVSDVIFGDDNGDGDDDSDDDGDGDSQGPDAVLIELIDSWDGSWQGQMTVTNSTGDLDLLEWTLIYDGGPDLTSIWNAAASTVGPQTTVHSAPWNSYLPPGASATFGFIATGTWPPTFGNATLNGYAIDIDGAPNDDDDSACAGDTNLDDTVDVLDVLIVLAQWNSTEPGNPADLDGDGVVAVGDILVLLESWGPCP